jgi:biopolymer transport protein ExbB
MTSVRFAQCRSFVFAVLFIATTMFVAGTAFAQEPSGGAAPAAKSEGGIFDFVIHFFKSLGIPGLIVLGAISICMVALIVMLLLDLRTSAIIPGGFVEEFTDTVNKRQFKQAFDLARADSSFLGRVLTAGMSRLQYGLEDAREAATNMLDTIKSGKDQLNSYLSVIGTVGPLLGLVGTVYGMIKAFMALNRPDASIDPKALAEGISHALCMTLAGVGLALPAIFFNAFFKNRILHVSMDCGNIADDLLTQMYHNSKKPAPPGTPVAPTITAVGNGPTPGPSGITPSKPV